MGHTILIVDDELELLVTLEHILKKAGYNILTAPNGNAALAIIKSTPVDIVISDVRMPSGGGIELLEKVRERDPDIPVVLLITGFTDVEPEEAIKKGAQGVLQKPFSKQALLKIITTYLPNQTPRPKVG